MTVVVNKKTVLSETEPRDGVVNFDSLRRAPTALRIEIYNKSIVIRLM